MRSPLVTLSTVLCLFSAFSTSFGQSPQPEPSVTVPRVINVSGVFTPADGQAPSAVEVLTLSIYAEPEGGLPLWQERQTVAVDKSGRFTLMAGATHPEGIPVPVFGAGQAQWMSLLFERVGEVEQSRVRITSVPYALKASDAETLGGLPASAYVLAPTRNRRTADGTPASKDEAATSEPTLASEDIILDGTTNFLAKYVNTTDLGNSAVYESSGRVGIGTTTPADILQLRFTDTVGNLTGLAVQNLGNTNASYSGMLFYDHFGNLGQFQGFNNLTHEYRINNIARNVSSQFDGSINFMIGAASRFRIDTVGTTISGPASIFAGGATVGLSVNSTGTLGMQVENTNPAGGAVFVRSAAGYGLYGSTDTGNGVVGVASASGNGIYASSATGKGVVGVAPTSGDGVYGTSATGKGVAGIASASGDGVWGSSGTGRGVVGVAPTTGDGVYGSTDTGTGAVGFAATSGDGVAGFTNTGHGVVGFAATSGDGVLGLTDTGAAIVGFAENVALGWAGFFDGDVSVTGTLFKAAGAFRIDHPLDPENKYLSHSFVESPDMKNIYDGVAVFDDAGEAIVILPDWFEALNGDFRYQLTPMGASFVPFIADEIADNQFRIAGGVPGRKVSWQVTGIRHDAFAKANRIQVEATKPTLAVGTYLHPQALGLDTSVSTTAPVDATEVRDREKTRANEMKDRLRALGQKSAQ